MQHAGHSVHVQCHAPRWQLVCAVCKVVGAELVGQSYHLVSCWLRLNW